MRIPIESSTTYRGRDSRPNWLILAAFVAAALGGLYSRSARAIGKIYKVHDAARIALFSALANLPKRWH